MQSQRFIVTEIEGYAVPADGNPQSSGGHTRPLLSVSVLDTVYNYAEVARFNQEEWSRRVPNAERPVAILRERIRREASALAERMEVDHAA